MGFEKKQLSGQLRPKVESKMSFEFFTQKNHEKINSFSIGKSL